MGRIYIDQYTGRIARSDVYLGTLTLKDGTVIENLEPRRLFPVTNANMYITLLDGEEKEVAFVRDLEELDKDSAKALQECFKEYYRIPQITRLIDSEEKFGSLTWTVETDRGVVSFRIRNRHSDIKCWNNARILVRDTNDNRYEIDDYKLLDAHSRRLLFSYL
ncbi:MAG: DUF1854 domain-containing protein [Clostridia bacterium]|nr:DUF1854 domain-containing protein [Clostridia bacterium]